MKQERLFLFILIVIFTLAGASAAHAGDVNQAVADASLAAYEKSLGGATEDPSDGSLPRWKTSLAEIQGASAALLETNSTLNEEFRQIRAEVDARHAEVEAARARNADALQQIEGLRAKSEANSDAVQVPRFKEILADRKERIAAQQELLAALNDRVGGREKRLMLARLRVQALEVDKRALEVDVKVRDEALAAGLRKDIAQAKDRISRSRQQVDVLREKTLELSRIDNPYLAQVKEVVTRSLELKGRLAALQSRLAERQSLLQQVLARKAKLEAGPNVRRVQKLLSDRAAVEAQLKESSAVLNELRRQESEVVAPAHDFSVEDIARFKEQNGAIEEIIVNLRENIALLEYKVTTLQRYKDRKGPGR